VSFQDRILTCANCGASFTFTAGEQEFYAQKGFVNDPKRCPTCRSERRDTRFTGSGSGGGGGYWSGPYRAERQMYPVVCASCGTNTMVPFQPREGRPVYCSSCYERVRAEGR
jgi:CxxC-x17-CxxC domain-containing protein